MKNGIKNKIFRWNAILSVVIIFLLSGIWHFLYDVLGGVIAQVFAPINESLAEHVKIIFYPCLIWWLVTYLSFKKSINLAPYKWFTSAFISTFTSISILVMLFCFIFYGLAVKIDNLPLHLVIETVSLLVGQWVGYHVYIVGKGKKMAFWFWGLIIVLISILIGVFSFIPPCVPIYISS